MANITEKNGKFHVRVYRKGASAVCKSFLIKKDALAWARQTEADIQSGRWQAPKVGDDLTLKQALEKYQKEITSNKKGEKQESYIIGAIARVSTISLKTITTIGSVHVASLRDQWKTEGLAPATIVRRMAILSHVFEIASKEWGYIDLINPVKRVRKPTVSNARDRRLFAGELEAVLTASQSDDLPNVARLALATAMRMSEVVGLRWTDISQSNRTLLLRTTKNGHQRVVPLSPDALKILSEMRRKIDGRVFGVNGTAMSKAWARAVKRARAIYEADCTSNGIAPDSAYLIDLRFHDLRHERISRLFELGILNTMEVAAISGHRTIQMLSRYTHLNASKIADKLAVG